jgi:DnaJ-class molecular chaperone
MSTYEKLVKAKTLLGLGEKASLTEVKNRYKKLIRKWHPDNNPDDQQAATRMSADINEAYKTLLEYCKNYEYPFDEQSLKRAVLSPQEWLKERFETHSTNTTI